MNNKIEHIRNSIHKLNMVYSCNTEIHYRENDKLNEIEPKLQSDLSSKYLKLKEIKKDFFDKFDYDWFLEEKLFDDFWERHLQFLIIEIIADILPNHPNYLKLGDIIIKFVDSETYFAECRSFSNFKWILISKPLKALLRNYVWLLSEIYEYGKSKGIKDDFTCCKIIDKLGQEEFIKQKTLSFLGTIINLADFKISTAFEPQISNKIFRNITDRNYQHFAMIFEEVELFILTHELAHILESTIFSTRDMETELSTDNSACSLSLISVSKNLKSLNSIGLGASIFFELSILFLVIRYIIYVGDDKKRKFAEQISTIELVKRRDMYVNHIRYNYLIPEIVLRYKILSTKIGMQFSYIKDLFIEQIQSNVPNNFNK